MRREAVSSFRRAPRRAPVLRAPARARDGARRASARAARLRGSPSWTCTRLISRYEETLTRLSAYFDRLFRTLGPRHDPFDASGAGAIARGPTSGGTEFRSG